MPMFHLLKVLIINALCYEDEIWNKKTSQGKYYVRARKATRPHLGATRPRVGICLSRLDALTSKYNTFSYCLGHRPPTWQCRRGDEAAEKSPDVGRRYRCKYLRISLKISNFTSNSNTL